jgi:hypothetical protein
MSNDCALQFQNSTVADVPITKIATLCSPHTYTAGAPSPFRFIVRTPDPSAMAVFLRPQSVVDAASSRAHTQRSSAHTTQGKLGFVVRAQGAELLPD